MSKTNLYYTAPSDEYFEDLKKNCIALWSTMGDEPSYAEEKINRIKEIKNIQDNFMYMFAMFDHQNQRKVAQKLHPKTIQAINERLVDGGSEYALL